MSIHDAVRLAKLIADDLFENGSGHKANRLQLRGPDEEDLGGLCKGVVVDAIATVLRRNMRGKRK